MRASRYNIIVARKATEIKKRRINIEKAERIAGIIIGVVGATATLITALANGLDKVNETKKLKG